MHAARFPFKSRAYLEQAGVGHETCTSTAPGSIAARDPVARQAPGATPLPRVRRRADATRNQAVRNPRTPTANVS